MPFFLKIIAFAFKNKEIYLSAFLGPGTSGTGVWGLSPGLGVRDEKINESGQTWTEV